MNKTKKIIIKFPDGRTLSPEMYYGKERSISDPLEAIDFVQTIQWTDLGLPSGTRWARLRCPGKYTREEALRLFSDNLPTDKDFQELTDHTRHLLYDDIVELKGEKDSLLLTLRDTRTFKPNKEGLWQTEDDPRCDFISASTDYNWPLALKVENDFGDLDIGIPRMSKEYYFVLLKKDPWED